MSEPKSETAAERLSRGRTMMNQINRSAGEQLIHELEQVAPGFEDLLLGFVFADVYDRPTLPLRERQLVRLGALTALGCGPVPLSANIGAAVNIGISRGEVAEALLQCLPYAGFPRVIDALEVLKDVGVGS